MSVYRAVVDTPDSTDTSAGTLYTDIEREYSVNGVKQFPEWESLPEKHLVSDAASYLAYFKAFVGTGVLFLPSAFAAGGFVATAITVCC